MVLHSARFVEFQGLTQSADSCGTTTALLEFSAKNGNLASQSSSKLCQPFSISSCFSYLNPVTHFNYFYPWYSHIFSAFVVRSVSRLIVLFILQNSFENDMAPDTLSTIPTPIPHIWGFLIAGLSQIFNVSIGAPSITIQFQYSSQASFLCT